MSFDSSADDSGFPKSSWVRDALDITETTDELRIAWDNRQIPKERFAFWFLILLWLVFAPITILGTPSLFVGKWGWPGAIWLVFGWLVTLLIPYMLAGRWRREWIVLSPTSLTLGSAGMLAPRPHTYSLDSINEIALGWYEYGGERESMPSLNIVRRLSFGFLQRTMFGYWLSPSLKQQVFNKVAAFIAEKRLPLEVAVYGNLRKK